MPRSFQSFDVEDWTAWLNAALAGRTADPPVPNTTRELHQDLLGIFRSLPTTSAQAFATAVGVLFRSTALISSFSRSLSILLQLAATTKPPGLDNYLDNLLRSETCQQQRLRYGNRLLHSDVLSTLSKYGIDTRLVDYMEDSASRTDDFAYALNCFRIAAQFNTKSARRLIPFVADLLEANGETAPRLRQFGVQLLDVALRHQFSEFLELFLDVSEQEPHSRLRILADAILHSGALEEQVRSEKMIAAQKLVGACVTATIYPLDLKKVIDVARAHRVLGMGVARRAVAHLWRTALRRDEKVMPWDYRWQNEELLPAQFAMDQDRLFNDDGESPFDADEATKNILSEISDKWRPQFAVENIN